MVELLILFFGPSNDGWFHLSVILLLPLLFPERTGQ